MRVLAVSHAYPRFDGDVAGAFLERLYAALTARGHAVRVIVPSDAGQGGEERRHGLVVERVRYAAPRRETLAHRGALIQAVRSPGGALAFRAMHRALAAAVRRRVDEADVVHANWWVPAGLAVRRAGVTDRVPCVLTLHGTDAALLRRSRVARWMAGPVLRDAARTTAVSGFLAQTAARAGAADPVVLPMPADPERFPEAGPGGAGIVTVGRLTRQKRTDLLIEAVAILRARGHATPFTIVGDGPERAALEALAARRGLKGQVRFAGAVPPADVPAFLVPADVFAFAARHEGFGLAAAEALIAGVPLVVMADGGGVLDIARPGAGTEIVPAAEPRLIAEAIARLLAAPGARDAARRAGRHWRDVLRPAAVAERLEQIFEEARRP